MAAKRKPGRRNRTPDKLTPEVQKVVLDAVAVGVPQKYAAQRAGVGDRTVREWVSRGRRDKTGPYAAFFAAFQKAQADRLAASVARIGKAGQGGGVVERVTTTTTGRDGRTVTKVVEKLLPPQWTADAWFLERTAPDAFAGNRREVRDLREQLAALLKAIAGGKITGPDPAGAGGSRVGGEARPDAV